MKLYLYFLAIFISTSYAYSQNTYYRSSEFIQLSQLEDIYSSKIRPILDRRCVSCHSCNEAPCNLKLESPEGIARGAHLFESSYNRGSILFSNQGYRLFYDAKSVNDWRNKGFFSVIEPIILGNQMQPPIMQQSLINGFMQSNGSSPIKYGLRLIHGMPFKMAPLDQKTELIPLLSWLSIGAPLPSEGEIETLKKSKYPLVVSNWEDFFNTSTKKAQWTAKYLYEHLFETHFCHH